MYWLALAVILLVAGLLLARGDSRTAVWLLTGIACVLVGFLSGAAYTRHQIKRLHTGVLNAQYGVFDPVNPPSLDHTALVRFYQDYNQTMAVLSGMFVFVEDCQRRFLSEHNKLNVVMQSLPLALLGVDDNVHVNMANRQAESLFAVRVSRLLGASIFDVLELDETERDLLRDAFLYKHPIRNRVVGMTLGGTEYWLTMNLSFVTEREGDMAAIITLLDITDNQRLQESVYHREKLVAMGQLAAGVAHELNTPLGNMSGYAQLLGDSTHDPERLSQYAAIIREEARRCSRIIQNLLNFARREYCYGDRCKVNTLIHDVVGAFVQCRLRESQIIVECDLAPEDPLAQGGCEELEIVLTNLLINAIQALETTENPIICVRSRTDGPGAVTITVEDNGPGVPAEVRARIFDPFFSTKDVGEGSGLGLSISQAMLARRGGSIKLDSTYSFGARFVLHCPAYRRSVSIHADAG